jgi:hypothetical protein
MPDTAVVSFSGRVLAAGQTGPDVLAVQRRLNQLGCGPIAEDGAFGPATQEAVELFQMRSADHLGSPLRVDGKVGPLTWAALFNSPLLPEVTTAPTPLLVETLKVAAGEIGVMESPLGSNRGPKVDEYLRCVGLDPASGHYSWCAAFVYWCFDQAAASLRVPVANPVIPTAGVLDHWNRAGTQGIPRISSADCADQPSLVQPGMIFILSTGGGNGHTGLVEAVRGFYLTTIEGNSNNDGSREGVGVFRQTKRKISDISRGFIAYG